MTGTIRLVCDRCEFPAAPFTLLLIVGSAFGNIKKKVPRCRLDASPETVRIIRGIPGMLCYHVFTNAT